MKKHREKTSSAKCSFALMHFFFFNVPESQLVTTALPFLCVNDMNVFVTEKFGHFTFFFFFFLSRLYNYIDCDRLLLFLLRDAHVQKAH